MTLKAKIIMNNAMILLWLLSTMHEKLWNLVMILYSLP